MLTLFSDTSLGIVIRFIPPPPWWHHHPYHHHRSLLSLLLSASLEGTLAVDRGRPANRGFQHRGQLHNKPACHQRRHRHGERPRGLKAAGFYGLKAAGFRGWKRVKNPGMISSGVGNSSGICCQRHKHVRRWRAWMPLSRFNEWLKDHMNLIPYREQDAPTLFTVPMDGQRGKTMTLYMAPRCAVWTPIT